jgi:L-threonylcarbamoyladenylate synthase
MKTTILKVNPRKPRQAAIRKAAQLLQNGQVVAFPTETVYGLGADALNTTAARRVFAAKGRPSDDPLIVHVARVADVSRVAQRVSPLARKLMRAFWPGPLTIVLPAKKSVPSAVTAGLPTVAVRMPAHPVARALCALVGPIAAPSANTFGRPSPTRAAHVFADLHGKIPLILDGGSAHIGVESTIVGLADRKPLLLRPGKITVEQLRKHIPSLDVLMTVKKSAKPLAPGMKYRHYAPRKPVILVLRPTAAALRKLVRAEQRRGRRVGVLCSGTYHISADKAVLVGKTAQSAARKLFDALRWLDKQQIDVIVAEGFPEHGLGLAVMNRLRRAATSIISS